MILVKDITEEVKGQDNLCQEKTRGEIVDRDVDSNIETAQAEECEEYHRGDDNDEECITKEILQECLIKEESSIDDLKERRCEDAEEYGKKAIRTAQVSDDMDKS